MNHHYLYSGSCSHSVYNAFSVLISNCNSEKTSRSLLLAGMSLAFYVLRKILKVGCVIFMQYLTTETKPNAEELYF